MQTPFTLVMDIAKMAASEKSMTGPKLALQLITTKIQKITL